MRAAAANHDLVGRPCRLDALAGGESLCPEEGCPFWEPGGAVLEGRCAFERLDLAGRPALVSELLRVRERLGARAAGKDARALHLYHQLLNESGDE